VEVHEPIEPSFGTVSVVGPGIGILHEIDMLQGEEGFWEVSQSFFSPIRFNGGLLNRSVLDLCVKS